jgi:anti-sigma regulatory factor (Ser/Thr protein kinase)
MAVTKASHASQIGDQSGVGEARRAALAMAGQAGFNENDAGKVAIAVTEAASNILKHAGSGEILLRALDGGVEMLAVDKGQGIANMAEAMRDGGSTAGTNGIGLGAISRMASVFDIHTTPGSGTVVLAQFYQSDGEAPIRGGLQMGAAQSPYPGESLCGDAWACMGSSVLVVDGLGHGMHAAEAASAAIEMFEEHWQHPVRETIEYVHGALRSTRGAAVAVAAIDARAGKVHFCGLGNISGTILGGGQRHGMMSHNGTAGHEAHRIVELEYGWPEGALLVMHTDGISAKWDLDSYAGLAVRHPSLIAAVLYRDFRRQRDDATIVVVRSHSPRRYQGGAL